MNRGYIADMEIIDHRLTMCENKLEKLGVILEKILKLLEDAKNG